MNGLVPLTSRDDETVVDLNTGRIVGVYHKMPRSGRCIAMDFDGVIHQYKGWNNGFLDVPIPGVLEFIKLLQARGAEVVVFSTRDAKVIKGWLAKYKFPDLAVTDKKLQKFSVFIDDRNMLFVPNFVESEKSRDAFAHEVMYFTPYWRDDA